MSIYVDGERSRQRLGFAKSLLNKIKMLGLQTKTLLYEGFLYRVQVIAPGLDKVAVTAPMGAFFMCMTKTNARVMKSDWYLGLVEPSRPYYTLVPEIDSGAIEQWQYYLGLVTEKLLLSATSVGTAPAPSATVAAGEFWGVWYAHQSAAGHPGRVNFDMNLYVGDGSQEKTHGFSDTTLAANAIFCQVMPTELFWYLALDFPTSCGTLVRDINLDKPISYRLAGRVGETQFGAGIPTEYTYYTVPSGLYALVTNKANVNYFTTVGGYAYSRAVAEAPTVTQFLDCTSSGIAGYFNSNPTLDGWKMTCSVQDIQAGWVVCFPLADMLDNVYNFSGIKGGEDNNFLTTYSPAAYAPIPAKIAAMTLWRTGGEGDGVYTPVYVAVDDGGDPPVIIRYDLQKWELDTTRLKQAARQLMPWPNSSDYAPIDSAMFHTHDDKVIIVSKRYPAVAIDTVTGLYRTTVVLPTPTLSAGIRPEIFHAGDGVYYCIGRNVAAGTVVGTYIGSPYTGWTTLPYPDDTLVQIRMLECSATRQVLMGVTYGSGGYKYHILFSENGTGSWQYISDLDITTDPADCSWSMSVYGDDPLVVRMKALLSQPPATQSYRYSPIEAQP